MAVKIFLFCEGFFAIGTRKGFRRIRVVSLQMLSQLVFLVEGFAAFVAGERPVFFVAEQVNVDLVSGRIKLVTNTALESCILIVVPAVLNDVVDDDARTHHTSRFLLCSVRFEAQHHFFMRAEYFCANGTDVLVVFGPRNHRLFQQLANQFVPFKCGLIVKSFVAKLTRQETPSPMFLQSRSQLCVMNDEVSSHFELTDEGLAAYFAKVILFDIFLRLFQVFVDGFSMTSH